MKKHEGKDQKTVLEGGGGEALVFQTCKKGGPSLGGIVPVKISFILTQAEEKPCSGHLESTHSNPKQTRDYGKKKRRYVRGVTKPRKCL